MVGKGTISPSDAGFSPKPLDDLKVTTPAESARRIEEVFGGTLKGACLESILINAGAAFMALDSRIGIREGVSRATESIRSGEALRALRRARLS